MRKHTSVPFPRSSTKLRLRAEVIRELSGAELLARPVGGCRTGSDASEEPTYQLAWDRLPQRNSTCPMM